MFLKMQRRLILPIASVAALAAFAPVKASEPDPAVMTFKLPDHIEWKGTAESPNRSAVIYGDPTKPGLYVQLMKWNPNHMSRPHKHPNDRIIHVISGTWWVGWGTKYDPASTFPIPAGSVVTHYGNQVHYDGAKDGEAVLEIVGIGPATSVDMEQK